MNIAQISATEIRLIYARRVDMKEIKANEYNLNITRYVNTVESEVEINLQKTHEKLVKVEAQILDTLAQHNSFVKELDLPSLPSNAK